MSTIGTNRLDLVKSVVTTALSWSPLAFTKFAIRPHYQSQPLCCTLFRTGVSYRAPRDSSNTLNPAIRQVVLTRASVHIAVCFSISLLSIVLYNTFTFLLYLFTDVHIRLRNSQFQPSYSRYSEPLFLRL